jgi:hypothetical protein
VEFRDDLNFAHHVLIELVALFRRNPEGSKLKVPGARSSPGFPGTVDDSRFSGMSLYW